MRKQLLGFAALALSGAGHMEVSQEIKDEFAKYFDETFTDSDFATAQKDKRKQGMNEYEAFTNMHSSDGTLNKCVLKL